MGVWQPRCDAPTTADYPGPCHTAPPSTTPCSEGSTSNLPRPCCEKVTLPNLTWCCEGPPYCPPCCKGSTGQATPGQTVRAAPWCVACGVSGGRTAWRRSSRGLAPAWVGTSFLHLCSQPRHKPVQFILIFSFALSFCILGKT